MIDAAIAIGSLRGLLDTVKDARDEQATFDVWLHKVWTADYLEFSRVVNSAGEHEARSEIAESEQTDIIRRSLEVAGISQGGEDEWTYSSS